MADRRSERELVTRRTEACDRAERDVREKRFVAERLAGRDIRQVQLDEWDLDRKQRVAQGDAGVSEGGRVEEDHGDSLVASLIDALDELRLRVALERVELVPRGSRLRSKTLLDLGQGRRAVDAGLARSKLAQIGAIQQ